MWQDILGPGEMQRSPGLSWKKEGSDLPLEFHILFIYLLILQLRIHSAAQSGLNLRAQVVFLPEPSK